MEKFDRRKLLKSVGATTALLAGGGLTKVAVAKAAQEEREAAVEKALEGIEQEPPELRGIGPDLPAGGMMGDHVVRFELQSVGEVTVGEGPAWGHGNALKVDGKVIPSVHSIQIENHLIRSESLFHPGDPILRSGGQSAFGEISFSVSSNPADFDYLTNAFFYGNKVEVEQTMGLLGDDRVMVLRGTFMVTSADFQAGV